MIIARGTPHGGSCLYTFAFVFEVKGGRVAASTLVYAALSLCLCLCPSYASAMPARHGCRKVPVAPHRVRGRLTHSPPGPSPPVLHPLASRLSALTTLLSSPISRCLFTPPSRSVSASLRSLCLCYFFSPPSLRASLSLLHLRSRCSRRFVRSCKRTGQTGSSLADRCAIGSSNTNSVSLSFSPLGGYSTYLRIVTVRIVFIHNDSFTCFS